VQSLCVVRLSLADVLVSEKRREVRLAGLLDNSEHTVIAVAGAASAGFAAVKRNGEHRAAPELAGNRQGAVHLGRQAAR
jgi:hypothetical protein